MEFTTNSEIVKGYVLLIQENIREEKDIPDIFNLQAMVTEALDEQVLNEDIEKDN